MDVAKVGFDEMGYPHSFQRAGIIAAVMDEWMRGSLMPETVSVQQNDLVARIDCPVTTSRLNTGDTTCLKSHHWLCICRPIIFSLLLSSRS